MPLSNSIIVAETASDGKGKNYLFLDHDRIFYVQSRNGCMVSILQFTLVKLRQEYLSTLWLYWADESTNWKWKVLFVEFSMLWKSPLKNEWFIYPKKATLEITTLPVNALWPIT